MTYRVLALAVVLVGAWPAGSVAQTENPVRWSAALRSPKAVAAGTVLDVVLTARLDPGWHLYSTTQPPGGPIATRITLPDGQPFSLQAPANGPAPQQAFDPNFSMETEFYDSNVEFIVSVAVAPSVASGTHPLRLHVYFQTCDERFCLPPRTERLEIAVRVTGGAPPVTGSRAAVAEASPAAVVRNPSPAAPPPSPLPAAIAPAESVSSEPPAPITFDRAQPSTLWGFVGLALTMGALSLLTPCVFPMVPITVSYFTSRAAGRRRDAVVQALVYCAGIILTFTALGMVLALAVGASGLNQFAANPWVNLLIAAIFLGFAASLFGKVNLTIPSAILTKLDAFSRAGEGRGTLATLLMGLTFTLTSFTCTAPFVGTLLVTASQGDWQWPLLGMLAFSTVFALPFFVLALMPQLLAQLPRSGEWMTSVKVSMGFLEVAAAVKFLSNVDLVWGWSLLSRDVVLMIWVALGIGLAGYLTRDAFGAAAGPRWGRRLAAGGVVLTTMFLASGLAGRRLGEVEAFLPPATMAGAPLESGTMPGELPWIVNDYETAMARARAENRLVLVDFTGYTCTNCRWMEANMFPRREVRRELEHYVRVRLYTDAEGALYEKHQQLQAALFKTVALPYYAVLSSDGTPLATFAGLTRQPEQFVAFLKAVTP